MRTKLLAVVGLTWMVACAGTGERAEPDEEASPEHRAESEEVAADRTFEWSHGAAAGGLRGYVVHNFNYTLAVEDPKKALAKARLLVAALGGEVTNASGNELNANLNAILPPGDHAKLRGALTELAVRVDNESVGRSDYAAPIEQAKRRLGRLEASRIHLVHAMKNVDSRDAADALGLLMELTENEKRNLESQLQSWREQTRGSQLYVAFVSSKVDPNTGIVDERMIER